MLSALGDRDESAIRFVFCDAEAFAGLKSSFGQQTDRLALAQISPNALRDHAPLDPLSLSEMPIKSSRGGVGPNASMTILERVEGDHVRVTEGCDAHPAEILSRRHIAATYRALRAISMGGAPELRALRVLYLVFGPRPPGEDRSGSLGHLWPIAKYTDAVEVVRESLVREEHASQTAHANRAEAEIAHACEVWEPPRWPKFHGPFEEEWYERFIRPTPCHLAQRDFDRMGVSAERMTTSEDALRAALLDANAERRARFIIDARRQCEALLAEATILFLERRWPR